MDTLRVEVSVWDLVDRRVSREGMLVVWKESLRMSKRKAHDDVAYVNGGFAERIASHLVGKSWLCGYSTGSKAPPEWMS